jgi:hypothetical protein
MGMGRRGWQAEESLAGRQASRLDGQSGKQAITQAAWQAGNRTDRQTRPKNYNGNPEILLILKMDHNNAPKKDNQKTKRGLRIGKFIHYWVLGSSSSLVLGSRGISPHCLR